MKKQLLSLAFAILVILGFSNQALALNSYAYGLTATLSDDAATLNVSYSLNADATAVSVLIFNGTEVVKTVPVDGANLTAGAHEVAVPTAGLPTEASLTWAVKATSAIVATATEHTKAFRFYHPRGVDVDINPESPYFGRVYVTESMTAPTDVYESFQTGHGVYVFDPQLTPVLNKDSKSGFNGGQTFTKGFPNGKSSYDPARIKISKDGRVFVSGQNAYGVALWELNPADLNAGWTKVIYGTANAEDYKMYTTDNKYIAGPNIGFDVRGEGENLQIVLHSSSNNSTQFNTDVSTDEYNLGTAKEWNKEPSKNIAELSSKYTVSYSGTDIAYDKDGGIWYCQHRATPSDKEPALIHLTKNADGTYTEDYKDTKQPRNGGAIEMLNDGSILAMSDGWGTCALFSVGKDEAGKPTLTQIIRFGTKIGGNLNDIAVDAANNIYVVGNSGEWLKVFALPRDNGDVTTPAPAATAFTLPAPAPEPVFEKKYTLTEVAKLTEGLPTKSEARQAVLGKNGKIYIQNKSTQSVEVWTKEGKTAETLANSTPAVAIASDDAGNIIVPGEGGGWTTNFANVQSLKVFPAEGGEPVMINVSSLPSGRLDFMSHIHGNILSGEAVMYLPASGVNGVAAVHFTDGEMDFDPTNLVLSSAVLPADGGTTSYADANGFLYYKRNVKGGAHYVKTIFDETAGEFAAVNELHIVTPGMYSSNGICKFTMGGVDYLAYNTGSGYNDGWSIVKCSDAADNAVIAEHPSTTTATSGYQTNWLMADVINDHTTMIYQYFPGGYIAAYEFTVEYPTAVYVAGTNNGWSAANAEMIEMTQPGIYEGLVTINANEGDANGGFAVSTCKGEWNEFNQYRLNAPASDYFINESDKIAVKQENNQNSFTCLGGTYNMVVNMNNNTVALYPENVYVVGSLYQHNWATNNVPAFTYEGNGKYSLLETILMPNVEGGQNMNAGWAEFTFITNCSAEGDANAWDKPNQRPRYGAVDSNIELESEEAAKVARRGGDALNWKIATGKYRLDLDLNNMTVVATYLTPTGVEETEAVANATVITGQGNIEVIGEAENVAVYTVAGALVSAGQKSIECAAGIYLVNVDGNVTKVIVK